ncbi:PREDICTED: serum amyloid P-component-like [Branchiostoma belcheri]|uniref:Serum amyloid P-component-like n=1 Tax=Branchiostoma belcheri TaxID=7741 RepID=A0A6P4YY75_BRABE|nr:PREDICTED: serum amyloid P-component-like [Branchiostoma belcheri]
MALKATRRVLAVVVLIILVQETTTSKDEVANETNAEKIDRLLREIEEYEEFGVQGESAQDARGRSGRGGRKKTKTQQGSLERRQLSFPAPPTTKNFVELPGMSEDLRSFTICLHMRTESDGGSALFTYYDKNGAEQISLYSDERRTKYKLRINAKHHGQEKVDLKNLDGKWHVICALWEGKHGSYEIWSDGKMRVSGEGLDEDFQISGGGTFVLGQGGDKKGKFDDDAAFSGDISHFNVWDEWLEKADLKSREKSCKLEGNVINWNAGDIKLTVNGKILIDKFTCMWKRELPGDEMDPLTEQAEKDKKK